MWPLGKEAPLLSWLSGVWVCAFGAGGACKRPGEGVHNHRPTPYLPGGPSAPALPAHSLPRLSYGPEDRRQCRPAWVFMMGSCSDAKAVSGFKGRQQMLQGPDEGCYKLGN